MPEVRITVAFPAAFLWIILEWYYVFILSAEVNARYRSMFR